MRLTGALPTRAALLALGALGLAAVQLPGRPATLCLLRGLTGVPCPFCGGTTAGVELGHGHLGGALAASPLALLGAVALVAVGPAQRARLAGRVPRRTRLTALALVLLASWVWQLQRAALL